MPGESRRSGKMQSMAMRDTAQRIAQVVGGGRRIAGTEITQPYLCGKNGKGQPEGKSASFAYRRLLESRIDERAAGRVLERMENILQRQNCVQEIVVPTVRGLFDGIVAGEAGLNGAKNNGACLTPVTYQCFSYNPAILKKGERYDIIDSFAWALRVQKYEPNFAFLVLDASKYGIINAMGRPLAERYSREAARQAVEALKKGFETNLVAGRIRESSLLRNRYLRAMAKLMPGNGGAFPSGGAKVISADELWSDNGEYAESLQRAVEFVSQVRTEGMPLEISRFASYLKYGQDYQKWYTPLVLAEADYLSRKYGASAKLGPTSEAAFDSLIRESQGTGYNVIWYARPLARSISCDNLVFFSDSDRRVEKKLAASPLLAAWLKEITQPFLENPIENVAKAVNGLKERINELAKAQLETENRLLTTK